MSVLAVAATAAVGCTATVRSAAPAGDSGAYSIATAGPGQLSRSLRIAGTTQAVNSFTVRIPRIRGNGSQFTLVNIVENGAVVKKGDVLAQFDATDAEQNALNIKATYDGLIHQVADTDAQNKANAETRASSLQQAETTLGTAQLEMKKGPILSSIDAQTDKINVEDATDQVASLKVQNALQSKADAAALRILELQRDQQKLQWEQAEGTVEDMTVKAPLAGMVALLPIFRSDSEGPAQPGDQLHRGDAILSIFDPGAMEVEAQINEADGANLTPGLKGVLYLDAYPGTALPVQFVSSSPVAVPAGFFSPIRSFTAMFQVAAHDPRVMPDLSGAIDLTLTSARPELLVPRAAVHFQGDQAYVSQREANGQWAEVPVELGSFDAQQVEILSGLKTGAQVKVPEDEGGQ
ncbi:MAG: efflux RND transporter periplasmic adaptor subunit [Terriglobales bacterium]